MIDLLIRLGGILLIGSFIGYIATVLKEKAYLRNNTVFINKDNVNPADLKKIHSKHFKLGNREIMAGDEIKVKLKDRKKVKGIVLGLDEEKENIILMESKGVKSLEVQSIEKLKIASKYGKFF